jgi:hypothetical protein
MVGDRTEIRGEGGVTLLAARAVLPSPHSPSKTGVNALVVGEGGCERQRATG